MEERQKRGGGRKLALLGALGLGLAMIGRRRRLGGMFYGPPIQGYGRGFGYGP